MTVDDVERAVTRIIENEDLDWMRDRLAQAQQQQRLGSKNCACAGPHGPRCFYSQAGAARREELYREAIARTEAGKVQA